MRDERGFTLIETLIASSLLIFVLGATLSILNSYERRGREVEARNDAAEIARSQVDELARELRNLASPTYAQPQAIDKATPYDLVFKSVDPNGPNAGANDTNVRRLRYCLDVSNPQNGRLLRQTQTWTTSVPPVAPATGSCPDPAWGGSRTMATGIVNRQGAIDRPIFAYDDAELDKISRVGITLWADDDPLRGPVATKLSSGVFLRNQNRKPTAALTIQRIVNRTFLLNGSNSSDPEGEQLDYVWYDGQDKVGEGVTNTYAVPTSRTGPRTITLKVFDESGLESAPASQEVTP